MAIVTGMTAARMKQIEESSVVSGLVDHRGRLLLSTKAGDEIDAGSVQGVGPAGTISIFAGANAPEGHLICDGSHVSRVTYSVLFSVIGTRYGEGDGSTTFALPNLKGRVVVGVDTAQDEFNEYAMTGGEKAHTLTTDEMPSHTHLQNSHNHTQNSHTHTQGSHTHTQSSHTHSQYSHTHGQAVHNHTQDSHTHSQSSHNHTQTTHSHSVGVGVGGTGSATQYRASGYQNSGASTSTGTFDSGNTTASNNSTTASNYSATATNNATAAENENATASNYGTIATNNSGTATNNSATATNNATTATNQSTGNGQAHNNLQPYMALNYIIKT